MREQVIDLQDVQGLVRGYGRSVPVGEFLLLTLRDAGAFREFLRRLGAPTTMEEWPPGRNPDTVTNIAFTYRGLAALGLPAALLESFPDDFKQGMRVRKAINVDAGASDPERWEPWWQNGCIHAWIGVYGKNGAALRERVEHVLELGRSSVGPQGRAFEVASRQEVGLIEPDDRTGAAYPPGTVLEHFGFADGLSEPAIEGVSRPENYPGSKINFRYRDSGWLPLAPGEFLLGHYKDEADERPAGPAMLELATNSTFMVYRKLAQDVQGFWAAIAAKAAELDIECVELAERMVGRRRDGTPLVRANGNAAAAATGRALRRGLNAFDYSEDRDGKQCPLGAHIRRANPRNSFGFGTVLVDRHRILRRGIPYGRYAADPALADPGIERGLVFIALNASISRQFEFVQKRWMNDGNTFDVGNDRDPIAGHHVEGSRFVLNAPRGAGQGAPMICTDLRSFVTTRGGDYFFLPGLGALRYLAEGSYHL